MQFHAQERNRDFRILYSLFSVLSFLHNYSTSNNTTSSILQSMYLYFIKFPAPAPLYHRVGRLTVEKVRILASPVGVVYKNNKMYGDVRMAEQQKVSLKGDDRTWYTTSINIFSSLPGFPTPCCSVIRVSSYISNVFYLVYNANR